MDPALAPSQSPALVVFRDGLGERRHVSDPTGAGVCEILCVRDELSAVPSFEFALRERVSRLSGFRHASYARVQSVDRLSQPGAALAVVADAAQGVRLSSLLAPRPTPLDINAALHLIRQLVSAVAILHETAADASHGAIGPERLVVTPNTRVIVVEYTLGAALERLRYTPERYWKELRVAVPPSAGPARFDQRTDMMQVGVVALSLVLGRLLRDDEYPAKISEALASAWAISAGGGLAPLPSGLRAWLARALQLDARHSFANAVDASAELDDALSLEDEIGAGEWAVLEAVAPKPEPKPEPVLRDVAASTAAKPQAPAAPSSSSPSSPSSSGVTMPHSRAAILSAVSHSPVPPAALRTPPHRARLAAVVAGLIAVCTAGAAAAWRYVAPSSPAPAHVVSTGTLTVDSEPKGTPVLVDGDTRGVTPLSMTLAVGPHRVELRGAGEARTIPVTITAGTQASQYIELGRETTRSGQLQIRTEPSGAQVSVDGAPRGRSPLLVEGLTPGEHMVVLESDFGTVKHAVTVSAASTASLVVPLGAAEGAPVSGWISIAAPAELQVFENKRLIGTSQSDRIMVSAGRHDFEIVNEALGYRASRTVQVAAGKVSAIKIDWPKGTIAVNALPWAEVWIDGEKVGETPIGNVSVPIGTHEIVFRHPDLGEQHYAATVALNVPARVSVDLRKKP
ncbi:MAG: PEGA domain-containing protein [Acidobacteriia bacterium]|nr:PEGA domain-containing protein [Terriglobia bacterium]